MCKAAMQTCPELVSLVCGRFLIQFPGQETQRNSVIIRFVQQQMEKLGILNYPPFPQSKFLPNVGADLGFPRE